jgi:4-amino-4-deoxy-L-arabinose transferase-like glycosyltransferase
LLGALILAVDPASFLHSQLMLTETCYTAGLVLSVAAGLTLIQIRQREWLWALLLGLSLAIGAHIRPVNYCLVFPVLLVVLAVKWRAGRSLKVLGGTAVALLVAGGRLASAQSASHGTLRVQLHQELQPAFLSRRGRARPT